MRLLLLICYLGLPCFGLTIKPLDSSQNHLRLSNPPPRKNEDFVAVYKNRSNPIMVSNLDADDPVNHHKSFGMTITLFFTYFAVISAKCALPSTLALLTASNSGLSFASSASSASISGISATQIGQQSMARLLTLSTFSIALGKVFLGPCIDFLGGIRSLQICLALLSTLMAVVSTTSSFSLFSKAWLCVDFIFSSCWAACLNAVHQSFPPHMWSAKVGMLASAARTGNAVAFATFAILLKSEKMKQVMNHILYFISGKVKDGGASVSDPSWRTVFLVSSLLQFIPITLLAIFGNQTKSARPMMPSSNNRQRLRSSSLIQVKQLLYTPLFWLHLTSRTALMIFGSFILFIPTFMTYCFQMTSSQSAQVGSIFALGCLLSLVMGSKQYNNLTRQRHKFVFITSLLTMSTICAISLWLHVTTLFPTFSMSPWMGTIIMFLWGFSFAIPFYLPPSLYALEKGGQTSSATIADIFDIGGYALLAVFNGYVARIPHDIHSAWSGTFLSLILCSSVSLISLGTTFAIDK